MGATFDPPFGSGKPPFKTREQTLEATVVKTVCKLSSDPAAALTACYRAHQDQYGDKGLSTVGLKLAGFTPPVLAAVVNVSPPSHVFNRFESTPLYQFWREGVRHDWWTESPARAAAFNWVGWGVCVLHSSDWLELESGRLTIPDPNAPEYYLYIDPITAWATAHAWTL